jgi:hypothetical protein
MKRARALAVSSSSPGDALSNLHGIAGKRRDARATKRSEHASVDGRVAESLDE